MPSVRLSFGKLLLWLRPLFFIAPLITLLLALQRGWGDWSHWGIRHLVPDFADLRVVGGAWESRQNGFDPLYANPADPWRRSLNYPRIWEVPGLLGARGHVKEFAMVLWSLFFGGVYVLLLGRSAVEQAMIGLLLCSPAVLFGLERGNIDLLIFALSVFAASASYQKPTRTALLAAFGFLVKLYPVVLLALLDWSNRAQRRLFGFGLIFVVCVMIWSLQDLFAIRAGTPLTESQSYGVACLGIWISWAHPSWRMLALLLQSVGSVLPIGAFFWFRSRAPGALRDSSTGRLCLAGALLYSGSFLLGSNYAYRAMMILLCVPWLMSRARQSWGYGVVVVSAAFTLWQIKIEKLAWTREFYSGAIIPLIQTVDWFLYFVLATMVLLNSFGKVRALAEARGVPSVVPQRSVSEVRLV